MKIENVHFDYRQTIYSYKNLKFNIHNGFICYYLLDHCPLYIVIIDYVTAPPPPSPVFGVCLALSILKQLYKALIAVFVSDGILTLYDVEPSYKYAMWKIKPMCEYS